MNYMNYVNYSSYFIAKDEVSTFYITPDEVSTLNTELFQLTVPELQARIAEASITPETARILSAPRLLSRFRLRDDPYTRSSRRAQQQLDIDSGGWFYDFTPEEAISAFESLRTRFTDEDRDAIQAYYAINRYSTQATPLINIARRLLSQNDSSALQKLLQLKQATQNYSGDFDANILREYGSKSTKQLRADIQKYTQQVSNLKTKGDRLNQELQAIRILSATGLLSRFRLSDDLYTPSSKRAQQQLDIDRGGWSYEFSPEEAISAFERLRTRFTNEDQDAIQAYYAINRYSTQATPLINIAERLLHEKNPLFRKARILSATGLLSRFRLRDDPYTPSSKRAQQQLDIDRKDWSYDFTPEEAISAFERLRTLFTNEDQDAIQAYYAINRYSTQATPLINIAQRLLSQNDSLVYTSPVLQRLIQQNQDKLTQATLNKRAAEHVLSVRDNTLDMLRIISPELSRQIDLPSKTYKEKTPASAQKGIDKPIRVNNPRSAKEFAARKVIIKNRDEHKALKSRLSEIKAQLSAGGLTDEERNTLATEKSTVEQQIKQLRTESKVRTITGKVHDYAKKIHKKRETLNSLEADDPDRVKLEQEIEDLTRKGESLDNADRELEQAINLGRKSTPGEVYTREMAKVDLDEHAKEYTKIKREYLKNMGEFSELSDELIITKDYLGPIYSIDEKGISYQSRALVDEYILDLILATTTDQMSSAKTQFITRIGDSQQKTKEERQAADKESRERMHAKLERVTPTLRATMTRSGGPSGTSLESETGTELKKVKTVPQFQQDAHQSGTLVVPGDSGTNTLMLMSALGNHYTQLGDNDGDSFQSAVTQMAVLTRRIRESENQLQELVNKDRELRRQPIPGEASLTSDLREKEIQEKRAELVKVRKHYEDMQKQYSLLLKNSQSKAQKGIRTYAKIYSALPEELLNDEIIKDLHLKSFVKQFRETLGGLSDNTASVNRATQNILTSDVLQSIQLSAPSPGKSLFDQVRDGELEFTIDDSSEWLRKYDGEEREQKKREAIEKFSQYVRTITESDTEYIGTLQGITDGSSVLSFLRQRVIEEISQATNIDAAITTTVGKPLKSAFGSVLNDDILQELQSIIGTSTGGLLGTTYNTVVPLISFQLANIGALKALKSTDDKSYRLALAASLMAKKPLELGEVRTFFEERETELLTGTLRSKTIIANIEAEKSIQTALRFIITTQQFIRDAGLKPKEPKGGSSSNKPSSLLESFASYQMLDENRAEYNLTDSAYDGQLKGLHKIFKAIEEANSPEDATVLREKFLQHYLSTEVGDKLDVNNPGDSSDERLVSLRTFGALQLLTDYLSGKYTSATDLINSSPLSKALTAAKVTKKYSGQADDDFVQSFITDLFLNFQDIYTSGQTSIDIGNRQEQVSSVDRIIESYGLSKDGSRLADYDNKIEEMVTRHLQDKGFDLRLIDSDTDLQEYKAKYKREIEGRSMAVEQALKSLGSAATDDQIYEATMKAVTSHNIRSSYDDFKGGLKQLKQLHHALKQMRDNNIPGGEKLEQELSLYTQLFANRVASGHTDLNLWSGFFGTMMSSVANLSNPEDEESINSLRMSLLGLSGSLFDLPETAEGDQDSLRKAFLAASMHTPTAEEKYNLARKYTETQYGDAAFSSLPDLDFSSADTEDGKTSLLRSGVEGLKALITAPLASAEEEYSKYTNFVNTIDQIRDLDPSKSAIDYASETNSFTFALRQLSGEYLEIANNLKTPENFSSEAQKEMEDRARALEAMLVDPTNNKNQLLTELRRLHYSEEDAEKVTAQLEQEINAVIREQTDKANSITRQKLAENVGRINAVSEGISILAIPALFALMESPEDSIGQISSGLNEAYQALISSPVAMGYSPHVAYSQQDITKNQLYAESINRGMQVSRIRSQIRNNDSIATGMFTGLMFETLYKTSSKVTQHVANFISDIDPEFNNSVRGRFATEVMGGIFGMVAANFLVNRQIGLPQEDFTELNNALIIIDQIRQATQAAFNSFSDAIVSSINDPVEASDSESSSYEGSARFTEDAALTFEQRQEVTGAIEIYFEDQA